MGGPPPPYVMLDQHGSSVRPPPYRRNVPRYSDYYEKRSGGSSCFRCICCCYCCLFLFVIILAILTFYFYTVFQPKVPEYNVMGLEVKAFDLQPDFSLNTEFQVTVKAVNPNSHIGFIYGKDSYVIVTYTDTNLCTGKLPNFHQGNHNTTIMSIDLFNRPPIRSFVFLPVYAVPSPILVVPSFDKPRWWWIEPIFVHHASFRVTVMIRRRPPGSQPHAATFNTKVKVIGPPSPPLHCCSPTQLR